MARVALDSNILVYAELEPETAKGKRAAQVILRSARDGVICVQTVGEFLRVVQRRVPDRFAEAISQAELYEAAFLTPPTTAQVMGLAAETARAHGLQLWDAVIVAAASRAGAQALFTEDLQDGRVLDGLKFINPFAAKNAEAVEKLLKA